MTIQKWVQNPDKIFICEELDTNVIPYLLFNMAIRNMQGYVINRNVLTKELIKVYKADKGEKFSVVEEIENAPEIQADEIISNPPYNIKWTAPTPLEADERFREVIPPSSNANYAFVLTALARMSKGGKCAFVLPLGTLTSKPEIECKKHLVECGLIERVIELPDNMFECTGIATCIYVLSNENKDIKIFNCRDKAIKEVRKQRGQFGGTSHTNRVYEKVFNVIPDDVINIVCGKCEDIDEFSNIAKLETIRNNNYNLAPNKYINYDYSKFEDVQHRDFQQIADNINFISRMKNACKLVINESIAKKMGFDVDLYKQDKQNSIENQKNMSAIGIKIETEDYIQFTKAKNEFMFKCNDKDLLPDIFIQFLTIWKNQIALLNTMENQYLAELRDALLPDLMSGKLDVSGIELSKKEGD